MDSPPASLNTRQPTPPSTPTVTSAPSLVTTRPEERAQALWQQALAENSSLSAESGNAVRHPQYYDLEAANSVIFLVEQKQLFRVFRPSLLRHSETLKAMFSMPTAEGKRPHGETDHNPVVLPSSVVTVERFELFLTWLCQDREVPTNLQEASTLLYLADYLDVPELLKRMAAYISTLPPETIPPAERVFLYRRYHFSNKQWLEDAFRSILKGSFAQLTTADLAHLGIPTIHRLIPIFGKLERHRTTLAVKPPPAIHENDCSTRDKCEVGWLTLWATRISPLLLSETSPADGCKITRTLTSWSVSQAAVGMHSSCLWTTAKEVSTMTSVIGADYYFIAKAVSELVDFRDY